MVSWSMLWYGILLVQMGSVFWSLLSGWSKGGQLGNKGWSGERQTGVASFCLCPLQLVWSVVAIGMVGCQRISIRFILMHDFIWRINQSQISDLWGKRSHLRICWHRHPCHLQRPLPDLHLLALPRLQLLEPSPNLKMLANLFPLSPHSSSFPGDEVHQERQRR